MAKQFVEGGLADCALALGFEKMEKGSLGVKYTDRTNADGQALQADGRRCAASPRRPPRRRCSATPAASTWRSYGTKRRAVREDRLEEPQALGEQPVLAVPGRVHARARSSHAPMVYEPLTKLQCCPTSDGARRGDPRERGLRARSTGSQDQGGRDPRHGDGHRLPEHLRREELHQAGRLRHDARRRRRRSTSSPASAPRTSTSSSCTTASRRNELITYEALGLCPEGKARRVRRLRREHLRRQGRGEPVGRPDLEGPPARRHRPRAVRGAQLAAARPGRQAPGRRARRSRCSTTSASAAPPS